MKTALCFILTLFTFVTFAFSPNSFAQDPRSVVRLIYFLPSDRQPQPDIDIKLNTLIRDVQKFYAEHMENHGFGRKTFTLEADEDRNVVVYHVNGRFTADYYGFDQNKVRDEIIKKFGELRNNYLVIVEKERFGYVAVGRMAFVGISGADNVPTIAHELGHTFGLPHDFRNDIKLIPTSYIADDVMLTSFCTAEWLDVHPHFNTIENTFNQNTNIQPPSLKLASPPYNIRVRFQVTDPDGLHQAQLLTEFQFGNWKVPQFPYDTDTGLIACKKLNGRSATVEFVTPLLAKGSGNIVILRVMDDHGNYTSRSFPINITALLPLSVAVSVPDPNLAAAVRALLGLKPREAITQVDMLKLSHFYPIPRKNITDFTGLEYATNLRVLDLWDHPVRNLDRLIPMIAGLTNLRELRLTYTQIEDVTPLAELTKLKDLRELRLRGNKISDVNPLAALTSLHKLWLDSNQVSDITPLNELMNLRELRLNNNHISDITSLAALTSLNRLWLSDNQISDVTPLTQLVNLQELYLSRNPVADTSPLANLTKLVQVDVEITAPPPPPASKNLISDLNLAAAVREALGLAPNATITEQVMEKLTTLKVTDRQIKNLTGLEHATQLQELSLRNNQIQDVRPIAELTQLVALDLTGNRIRDANPLAGLTQLVSLTINWNQISNMSPLAKLTQLEQLHLRVNKIRDVSPLSGLTGLKELSLRENDIRDVSPLAGLVNLEKLQLAKNPITDTSPLASLTKLVAVDIEISKPTPVVQVASPDHPPMYWVNTNNGTLHRLIGTEVEGLVPNVRNATNLTIDVENEKLYWTEKTSNTTGRIRRANLDGTKVQLVKDLTSVPLSITLDIAGGKIYLTNAWGKIQRLNVDGSNFQPNLITELDTSSGLALDVSSSKVYWIEASGSVRRANLDGSNIEDIATGLGTPINIAISGDAIYWTEKTGADTGEIRIANFNGNPTVMTLHTFPQGFPIGIAVDAVENKLYWTTSRGNIGRSNLDGSNFQPNFVTGLSAPGAFVLNVKTPMTVETPEQVTEPAKLAADVNNDGVVNIQDLVLVASNLGQTGQNAADVNADKIIDIRDLVMVAGALGTSAAAPSLLRPKSLEVLASANVRWWLSQAQNLPVTDPTSLQGILFLEQLLEVLIPTETALLPNYPNPFNPETWIPYQLANACDAQITIYDVKGRIVRRLILGYQNPGDYTSKARAAYWDGRNALGEKVASGLYFYTFTAGEFAATQKMLIRK